MKQKEFEAPEWLDDARKFLPLGCLTGVKVIPLVNPLTGEKTGQKELIEWTYWNGEKTMKNWFNSKGHIEG